MNQRAMIAATAAAVMSMTLIAAPAAAQEKEKCFEQYSKINWLYFKNIQIPTLLISLKIF